MSPYVPDPAAIQGRIAAGYLTRRQHPDHPHLSILNYTVRCQYERFWDEHTRACRGLIVDTSADDWLVGPWRVVARPFEKFWNLEENDQALVIPDEPFEVFEKMDGSLGILYCVGGEWAVATRGSFVSDQAVWATNALHTTYRQAVGHLDPALTYLVEIIYPGNRIVVDYRDRQALVLLAVFETASGVERPLDDFARLRLPLPRRVALDSIAAITAQDLPNHEGYVLRFASGRRIKIKFPSYVELHKLLSSTTHKTIWEGLMARRYLSEILEGTIGDSSLVKQGFLAWVGQHEDRLIARYAEIERAAQADLDGVLAQGFTDRRAQAEWLASSAYRHIVFRMLDGKDYAKVIWRMLRPVDPRPYMPDEEG